MIIKENAKTKNQSNTEKRGNIRGTKCAVSEAVQVDGGDIDRITAGEIMPDPDEEEMAEIRMVDKQEKIRSTKDGKLQNSKTGIEKNRNSRAGKKKIIQETENGLETESDLSKDNYLISEASRLVKVESHVLRYWEEELKLPIRRNELGHRYYTREDVQQFCEIKHLKEQGLQLRAIRTMLTDSDMQVIVPLKEKSVPDKIMPQKVIREEMEVNESASNKGLRLQMLLHNLVAQAVRDSNKELSEDIRQTVLKELDYQFRLQEEMEEKREQERIVREEEHFRNLDEMLRQYTGRNGKKEDKISRTDKRKKHSIF